MQNMSRNRKFKMVAKTMLGLEEVLAEELIALGADNVAIGNRMVSFEGDLVLMYKTNFHCRTALSILRTIYEFKATTTDEIYKKIKSMNWAEHLSIDKTFVIDAVVYSDYFAHSKFVGLRVKDAIADYFMQREGKRPSVDTKSPDLYINIHISHDKCTLSFNSSGESLHKRGYRVAQVYAPLNEVLAAGIILKSGWRGNSPLVDPMCGSGTFLIEGVLIAMNVPPGIYRKNYAFEKWNNFDSELFDAIAEDDGDEKPFKFKAYGSDILPTALDATRKNIKEAGLEKHIELSLKDIVDYNKAPAKDGIIFVNPPYGERLRPDDLYGLYQTLGERLKHVFAGYTACILSYDKKCFNSIGLKASSKYKLVNGSLDCEVRTYKMFTGKKYEKAKEINQQI